MTTYPKRIRDYHLRQAILDLGLDTPVYRHRVVGNRLEIHTPAGVFYWPPWPGDDGAPAHGEEAPDDE